MLMGYPAQRVILLRWLSQLSYINLDLPWRVGILRYLFAYHDHEDVEINLLFVRLQHTSSHTLLAIPV